LILAISLVEIKGKMAKLSINMWVRAKIEIVVAASLLSCKRWV
jgi:hypothetical protein